MQMTIQCPNDGEVVVDVGDVKAIVFDRAGHCEISFVCPRCGAELRQAVTPVAMQMSIVEPVALESGQEGDLETALGEAIEACEAKASRSGSECAIEVEPEKAEAYLEYFRRQLEHVDDVEAALKEIDG